MGPEAKLERHCRKLAEYHGCRLYKWVSPGVNGVPDRILVGPNKFIAFVEFKKPGEKPTVTQKLAHGVLLGYDHEVWLVDTEETFRQLLGIMPK
jgi:hypothetical protein